MDRQVILNGASNELRDKQLKATKDRAIKELAECDDFLVFTHTNKTGDMSLVSGICLSKVPAFFVAISKWMSQAIRAGHVAKKQKENNEQ